MPRIKTQRTKKPPTGFAEIEDTLLEFANRLKDVELASSDGRRPNEALWPVFQITHQRSRYVYDLYYTREAISTELYQWLLKQGYADANLIAKWKKQGYEKLCCLRCIQSSENTFRATCICRVPKAQLPDDKVVECVTCGCRGCASSD
ncbi:G10 protein [Limtongia smithiae]|uniref:G10 protein n=1 Tax=Limtongia smithiae TaxID=1125753 RepID=UPI0034CFEC8E